ncbi:MAG: chemotaxis response regulator protein-glutamate methylesterase [Myxococcales bacterium]|nr:chemotaxis response regulator protein-glutamate methylesterase [Myxococcales bacterium]
MMTVRVLVVDDSAVIRRMLSKALATAPGIEVVGTAPDPFVARDKLVRLKPDVMTLDIEMPRMDGISFLRRVMAFSPMPVLILSSLTPAGSDLALEALQAGALEVISKPNAAYSLGEVTADLIEKVRAAAGARVDHLVKKAKSQVTTVKAPLAMTATTNQIVAIGASTGGTRALEEILPLLPPTAPGTLVVQHMPEGFTRSFAERLDSISRVRVKEAETGDRVVPGTVLIAPGNFHMRLRRTGAAYHVVVDQQERVNRHRPSVDALFHSVAQYGGRNAVGVILTGMGADGAEGLLAMRNAGARTIGQDEASCIVYGMPQAAARLGGVEHVVSLSDVARAIVEQAERGPGAGTAAPGAKERASA